WVVFLIACSSGTTPVPAPTMPPEDIIAIPADTQRTGDPQAGYSALVNNGYVSCGIPASVILPYVGHAASNQQLPGRNALNASLPYNFNSFVAASGVQLVTANCLTCHASHLPGDSSGTVFVGLGALGDFTNNDLVTIASGLGSQITDPTEL